MRSLPTIGARPCSRLAAQCSALASATSVPADVFGLSDRGRIAIGLIADLVLVDGDPTSEITATRSIAAVWKDGIPIRIG